MRHAVLALALLALLGGCRSRREAEGAGKGVWTRFGPLVAARMDPRVAPLAEGRWLVTSGTYAAADPDTDTSGCAEVYDPVSHAFYELPGMETPRISHSLAVLPDGDVLVAGGWAKGAALDTLERFSGREGRFTGLPFKLFKARTQAQALALPGGRVALVGGQGKDGQPIPEVEVVDLVAGKAWVACRLLQPRGPGFQATLLEDGKILVSGGEAKDGSSLAALERLDPQKGKVEPLAPLLVARAHHAAVRLEDGRVLLAGGVCKEPKTGKGGPESRCELFDPRKGRTREAPPLPEPRVRPVAARLSDGRVLLAGGWNAGGPMDSTVFYLPAKGILVPGPILGWTRADDALLPLDRGRAVILGSGLDVAERLE